MYRGMDLGPSFREMLREAASGSRILFGAQNFSGDPASVEILGYAGFDWVSLDMEHTNTDFRLIEHLTLAAEVSKIVPLVRVAYNDPHLIGKALDAGAAGVIVPHVTTAEGLRLAVNATQYPPSGNRGVCGAVRGSRYSFIPWAEYEEVSNRETVVVPLIEDSEGLKNLDELLAFPEVPVYWIGHADLAASLGLPTSDLRDGRLYPLVKEANEKAAAAGKAMMVSVNGGGNREYRDFLLDVGFRCLSYGSDHRQLINIAVEYAAEVHAMMESRRLR